MYKFGLINNSVKTKSNFDKTKKISKVYVDQIQKYHQEKENEIMAKKLNSISTRMNVCFKKIFNFIK